MLEKVVMKAMVDTKMALKGKDKTVAQKQDQLTICIDHAWKLMSKYYKEMDKSRVYVVARVLDPR